MEANMGCTLTKTQRFILGIFILIMVDAISVSSSELSKFLYKKETFQNPFLSTYIKTSMLMLYLIKCSPWKDSYLKSSNYVYIDPSIDQNQDDENLCTEGTSSLSNPVYVPVKTLERDNLDRSSGTESDDSSIRSVRFNKLAEVRQMSEKNGKEALLARLSYQATLRAKVLARYGNKLRDTRPINLALVLGPLWIVAHYMRQVALFKTKPDMTTILSSTSSLLTLQVAAIYPLNQRDQFTISKLVAVVFGVIGTVLVNLSDWKKIFFEWDIFLGLIFCSAFFYTWFLVALKMKIGYDDNIDLCLFLGVIGLINSIFICPIIVILHFTKIEALAFPNTDQLMVLLCNGLFETVIPEALWLWGCFLTSTITATMAWSLTIPMTMLVGVLKGATYPVPFYIGIILLIIAFIAVAILSHPNWDPLFDCFSRIGLCRRTRFIRFRFSEMPSEQTEALISVDGDHEA